MFVGVNSCLVHIVIFLYLMYKRNYAFSPFLSGGDHVNAMGFIHLNVDPLLVINLYPTFNLVLVHF
jgi:hypothetical protein